MELSQGDLDQVRLLSCLANAKRWKMLKVLTRRELGVVQIAKLVGESPSLTSQYLSGMCGLRIVKSRRIGTSVFYSLAGDAVSDFLEAVDDISHAFYHRMPKKDGHN